MEYKTLKIEQNGAVANVVLNRPEKANSMCAEFWSELPHALYALDATGETRAIVISSTGKHFCAGIDLGILAGGDNVPMSGEPGRMGENLRRVVLQMQDTFNALERVRVPVLAAVHGGCIGAGLDMVSAADCRYATQDAYFVIAETDVGLTADMGSLQRLPKIIPVGVAREMAYTGRKVSAQEALDIGLVNRVYADQETMQQEVMALAQTMAEKSPLVVAGCKHVINYSIDHSVDESLNYMATWQAGMFRQDDIMKNFIAKSEKKKPELENLWPQTPLFGVELD